VCVCACVRARARARVRQKYITEISTLGVLARISSTIVEEFCPGRTAFLISVVSVPDIFLREQTITLFSMTLSSMTLLQCN